MLCLSRCCVGCYEMMNKRPWIQYQRSVMMVWRLRIMCRRPVKLSQRIEKKLQRIINVI